MLANRSKGIEKSQKFAYFCEKFKFFKRTAVFWQLPTQILSKSADSLVSYRNGLVLGDHIETNAYL